MRLKNFTNKWLILLVLLITSIGVLFFIINPNKYNTQIKQLFYKHTGMELGIDGSIKCLLLPKPSIKITNITINNPAGFNDQLLTAQAIKITISWSALFTGKIVVTGLEIRQPKITLYKQHNSNNLAAILALKTNIAADSDNTNPTTQASLPTKQSSTANTNSSSTRNASPNILIQNFNIKQAQITWEDRDANTKLRVHNCNISTSNLTASLWKQQGALQISGIFLASADPEHNIDFNANISGKISKQRLVFDPLNITWQDLNIHAHFTAIKTAQQLVLDPITIETPGGKHHASCTINLASQTPLIYLKDHFENYAIQELLAKLLPTVKLQGQADLHLDLHAQGKDLHSIGNSLNGTILANINNGKIVGFDLAKLLRELSTNLSKILSGHIKQIFTDSQFLTTIKELKDLNNLDTATDFEKMQLKLKFIDGISKNAKLILLGTDYAITGLGDLDLHNKALNAKLEAQYSPSSQDPAIKNIPLKFIISGNFTKLNIKPDLGGYLKAAGNLFNQHIIKRFLPGNKNNPPNTGPDMVNQQNGTGDAFANKFRQNILDNLLDQTIE